MTTHRRSEHLTHRGWTGHADLDRVAATLDEALQPLVQDANPPGLVWGLDLHGTRRLGALGHLDASQRVPAQTHHIFRISSMTKPLTAAAALCLVEDGQLALDQSIDDLIPELADRPVLRHPGADLTDTEPAVRSITVEDLLTFRLGHGVDFATMGDPTPLDERLEELGLTLGPPNPQRHLAADDWMARLGRVPLRDQPGHRWLYNTGAEVLGVLVARACGTSLSTFLRQRILDPLGMPDTGFWVPAESLPRFGACFAAAGAPGSELEVFDPPDGQWSSQPPFEPGDGGLVSTVTDYLTFAVQLRDSDAAPEPRLLPPTTLRAMTSNQLSAQQLRAGGPAPDGAIGWGYGLGVALKGPTPERVGNTAGTEVSARPGVTIVPAGSPLSCSPTSPG